MIRAVSYILHRSPLLCTTNASYDFLQERLELISVSRLPQYNIQPSVASVARIPKNKAPYLVL